MAIDPNPLVKLPLLQNADSAMSRSSEHMSPNRGSLGHKAWEYAKSRFNQDNWLGSMVAGLGFYLNYNTMRSGQTRKIDGIPTPDNIRIFSGQAQMAERIWSFFSARGGSFPEGKTVWERMMNTLRHPQISSTQFGYLVLVPTGIAMNLNHIRLGLKAYGIGLKPGEKPYLPERVRFFSGVHQLIGSMLIGIGHFRKHEAETSDTMQHETHTVAGMPEKSQRSVFHILGQMWKHDRVLMVGTLMSMVAPTYGAVESWMKKSQKTPEEARYLAKGAAISCLIVASEAFYTFQRIAKSNYREHVIMEDESASPQEIEELQETSAPKTRNASFASRFAQPQLAMAQGR